MIFRNRYLVPVDAALIALAVILGLAVRFDTLDIGPYFMRVWFFVPLLILIRLPIFYFLGLYRRIWRYASISELLSIVGAALLGSVLATALIVGVLFPAGIVRWFPRSVLVIEWLLTTSLAGGMRFSLRMLSSKAVSGKAAALRRPAQKQKRVLIAGAGDAGAMILREIRDNPGMGMLAVGFVDDDQGKLGMRVHGVPVLGTTGDTPKLARGHRVDEVIIAMPTAPGKVIRRLVEICDGAGLTTRVVPGLYELINGTISVSQIREVRLEDLLRREPVKTDLEEISAYLSGERVMVTGAAGSIGAELCRQIARFHPQQLFLLDHDETGIFYMETKLSASFPALNLVIAIGDIRDRAKVERLMSWHKPTVVFHAAAHKHVPLMEENVDEAVTTNILGTQNVADAAALYGVKSFVFISTDKAVRPFNVMGATKRVAEMLIQDMAEHSDTKFVAVRFGNVLGSRGSVVPLFQRQIASRGPVTVTHPEATRYFMTASEAVQLVIQAAALGKGAEIFVLDMGEPVKIIDLAKDLIRLSGWRVGEDIELEFIGLRRGEKLYEELLTAEEGLSATKHASIFIAQPTPVDGRKLHRDIQELEGLAQAMDVPGIRRKLQQMLPDFQPST